MKRGAMLIDIQDIDTRDLYTLKAERATGLENIRTQLAMDRAFGYTKDEVWRIQAKAAMGHLKIEMEQLDHEITLRHPVTR
jgi:hypothetical protein